MKLRTLTTLMLMTATAAQAQRAVRHASARMHYDGTRSGAGQVSTWGSNLVAQAGGGGGLPFLTPTRLTATKAVAVAAGGGHTLVLQSNGTVRSFGADDTGQLGDGPGTQTTCVQALPCALNTVVKAPDASGAFTNVVAITAGLKHSLVLNADGEVFAFGLNSAGQLGNPAITGNQTLPVPVAGVEAGTTLRGIKAIAAGEFHSLALASDGTLLVWGDDSFGQIGNGATTGRQLRPVPLLKNIVAIAAGGRFSLALHSDGSVFAWGDNSSGQGGVGSTVTQTLPVRISGPAGEPNLRRVIAIAAGATHALALTSDGKVWAWGSDAFEQLGNGAAAGSQTIPTLTSVSGAIAISAGFSHSLALLVNGTVLGWGRNNSGQIGNGTSGTNASIPLPVGGSRTLTRVMTIAAGGEHSVAVIESDQTQALAGVATAVPGTEALLTAVSDGAGFTLGIRHDGLAMAWGQFNSVGELGERFG